MVCRETDAGQIMEQGVPLTSIGFTKFPRCFIFDLSFFTNADVPKSKENSWNHAGQIKEQDVPLT